MTEEDQLLVAKAALAGVRFQRVRDDDRHPVGWRDVGGKHINTYMYTLGRAAAYMLNKMDEMPDAEYLAYIARTEDCRDEVEA